MTLRLDWFVNLFLWVQAWEELMGRQEQGMFQCQGSSCALVNGIYGIYALLCTELLCARLGEQGTPPKSRQSLVCQTSAQSRAAAISAEISTLGNSIPCPLLDLSMVAPVPGSSPQT